MSIAIVIPVLNQLAYTQGCLRDLQPDLAEGARVVIVDNGSTDGTREWLRSLEGTMGLTILRNEQNRGCAPAWNQGVTAAGAWRDPAQAGSRPPIEVIGSTPPMQWGPEWVVVLNNDVRLPVGWRKALIDAAKAHRLDIASPAMRERDLNYDLPSYARSFADRMSRVIRRGGAHGVCFAVRSRVFARIGGFDEAFRIGQFEDADFFRRARRAGFRLGVTGACFIHHFGSVTQDALSDENRNRPYEAENRARFRQKWKLGWARRRWEKASESLRAWWWRTSERALHRHSLHEKWDGKRVRYY